MTESIILMVIWFSLTTVCGCYIEGWKMEELENLKTLISKFIGLSPEFPEDEALAVQIGTSLGKLESSIQEERLWQQSQWLNSFQT